MHSLPPEAILLERIRADFVIYQNMVAGTEITDDFDVLNWFQIQKMQFPMLTRFAYIIQSITPLQLKMKDTSHLQERILHRVVTISLLKCSLV